jgi:hypothetical protein
MRRVMIKMSALMLVALSGCAGEPLAPPDPSEPRWMTACEIYDAKMKDIAECGKTGAICTSLILPGELKALRDRCRDCPPATVAGANNTDPKCAKRRWVPMLEQKAVPADEPANAQ